MKAAVVKALGRATRVHRLRRTGTERWHGGRHRRSVRIDQPDPRTDVGKPLRQQGDSAARHRGCGRGRQAGGRPTGVHRRDRAVRHDGRAGAGQSGRRDPASRRRRPRHRSRDSESWPFGLDVIGLRRRGQAGGACARARRNRGHRFGGGAACEVGVRRAARGRGGPQRRAAAVVADGWGRRRHRDSARRTLALVSPPRTPSGRSTPFSTTCGANPPKRHSQRWHPARPPRIITPPGSCRSVRWQARR